MLYQYHTLMTTVSPRLKHQEFDHQTVAENTEDRYRIRLFYAAVKHIGKDWKKIKQALHFDSIEACKKKWDSLTEYDKQDAREYIQLKRKEMLARKAKLQEERKRQEEQEAKINEPQQISEKHQLKQVVKPEPQVSFFVEKVLPRIKNGYQGLYSLVQVVHEPKKSKKIVKPSHTPKK